MKRSILVLNDQFFGNFWPKYMSKHDYFSSFLIKLFSWHVNTIFINCKTRVYFLFCLESRQNSCKNWWNSKNTADITFVNWIAHFVNYVEYRSSTCRLDSLGYERFRRYLSNGRRRAISVNYDRLGRGLFVYLWLGPIFKIFQLAAKSLYFVLR